MYLAKSKGFTLSEVLITLVIIGVIAAITVPVIDAQHRREQYRASAYKAISEINQATRKYYVMYGVNPQCGYWKRNPYGSSGNGAVCTSRNDEGVCTGWKLKDGSDLPSDYNGFFDDCTKLWKSFYQTMNVQQICAQNAYANGCIPKYEGRDSVYAANNSDKSDYDVMTAVASSGFLQSAILSGSAFVLADGTIFFSYMRENARYLAVDINGQKGPNKWGRDLYLVKPIMEAATGVPLFIYDNSLLEKGGLSTNKLLYK